MSNLISAAHLEKLSTLTLEAVRSKAIAAAGAPLFLHDLIQAFHGAHDGTTFKPTMRAETLGHVETEAGAPDTIWISRAKGKVEEPTRPISNIINEQLNSENKVLHARIDDLEANRDHWERIAERKLQDWKQVLSDRDSSRREVERLVAGMDVLMRDANNLKSFNDALKKERAEIAEERDIFQDRRDALSRELATAKKERDNAEKNRANLEVELAKKSRDFNIVHADRERIRREHEDYRKEFRLQNNIPV